MTVLMPQEAELAEFFAERGWNLRREGGTLHAQPFLEISREEMFKHDRVFAAIEVGAEVPARDKWDRLLELAEEVWQQSRREVALYPLRQAVDQVIHGSPIGWESLRMIISTGRFTAVQALEEAENIYAVGERDRERRHRIAADAIEALREHLA